MKYFTTRVHVACVEFIDNQNIYPDANVMLLVYLTFEIIDLWDPFYQINKKSEICLILKYDKYG